MQLLRSRIYIAIEFATLIVALPTALYYDIPKGLLLPILWGMAVYANFIYRGMVGTSERVGWNPKAVTWKAMKPILARFAIAASMLTLLTWINRPDLMFDFVRSKPAFWALVMVLYPLLSAAPQEIIFRQFFFTRYASYFPEGTERILASAIAFAFAHIFFHNWVAPILCLIGGVMFAATYAKHRSLLLVTIEHALYGCFIFTLGLGHYLYHGAIH